ncbi:transposase [Erysipelothrix sp. HDW6A]|nr:transposase [Erysipelothrix sp. HDW6A]
MDILQERRLSYLKSYFWTYPDEVRAKVETICIDIYVPYIECIQACFPNAKIITDRFHVIQHLSRNYPEHGFKP